MDWWRLVPFAKHKSFTPRLLWKRRSFPNVPFAMANPKNRGNLTLEYEHANIAFNHSSQYLLWGVACRRRNSGQYLSFTRMEPKQMIHIESILMEGYNARHVKQSFVPSRAAIHIMRKWVAAATVLQQLRQLLMLCIIQRMATCLNVMTLTWTRVRNCSQLLFSQLECLSFFCKDIVYPVKWSCANSIACVE